MHPRLYSFVALTFVALLVACGEEPTTSAAAPRRSGPREVVVATAEPVVFDRTLEMGGTLEAPEQVEIAARVEGVITSLGPDLGDRVRRGDVLARISAEDFAAQSARAEAELEQARSEATRAEQLVASDLATRESLEALRTKVRVAESQRALASRQLRDTRVTAPFDGAIAARRVSPGAFVRVGTPLYVLVATSPMRIAIDVPERLSSSGPT